jgi:Holliday junction resolvase-like predicted endonuclease
MTNQLIQTAILSVQSIRKWSKLNRRLDIVEVLQEPYDE